MCVKEQAETQRNRYDAGKIKHDQRKQRWRGEILNNTGVTDDFIIC